MSGPFDLPRQVATAVEGQAATGDPSLSPPPSPAIDDMPTGQILGPDVGATTVPDPDEKDRWAPAGLPRVTDGIVVPSVSAVAREGRAVYAPATTVKTVSSTARGVGFYSTAGQWVLVWEGDNVVDRDAALRALLDDFARWTRRW